MSADEPLEVEELTPRGPGGISVLAVRGPEAPARVARRLGFPPERAARPGRARHVRLRDGGAPLDEALLVPRSSRELELHLHGSPPVVRRVLELLAGRAPAAPRSLEERARARLGGAPCEAAARILLDQAEGALARELARLLADEDPGPRARELAARGRAARLALAPATVVLAGAVNAGKSTLFNALVGRERVVVSDEPGTTRDAVLERARLGAYAVDLVDTAGERDPGRGPWAEVEAAGQALAAELRGGADLVLLLVPVDAPPPGGATPPRTTLLRTCADRAGVPSDGPSVSALRDPEGASLAVAALFRDALGLPEEPWTPGAAVPFEPDLVAALDVLADPGSPPERRRRAREELRSLAADPGRG